MVKRQYYPYWLLSLALSPIMMRGTHTSDSSSTFTGSGTAADAGPRLCAAEPARRCAIPIPYAPNRHSCCRCVLGSPPAPPRPWPTSSTTEPLPQESMGFATDGALGTPRARSSLKPSSQARAWIRETPSRNNQAALPPVRGAPPSRRPSWIRSRRGMHCRPSEEPSWIRWGEG